MKIPQALILDSAEEMHPVQADREGGGILQIAIPVLIEAENMFFTELSRA